jgi:hypothetical protein
MGTTVQGVRTKAASQDIVPVVAADFVVTCGTAYRIRT